MKTLHWGDKAPALILKIRMVSVCAFPILPERNCAYIFTPNANTASRATQGKNVQDELKKLKAKNTAVIGIRPNMAKTEKKF